MFINAGLNKLLNYIPVPANLPEKLVKMTEAFKTIGWIMPMVAFAEIIGGLLVFFPKSRPLGAVMLFPVLIGILLVHSTAAPSGLPMVLVLFAIELYILFENRKRLMNLIK